MGVCQVEPPSTLRATKIPLFASKPKLRGLPEAGFKMGGRFVPLNVAAIKLT